MTAIADLSAADLVTAYRTRALSPVEVARDVIARARLEHGEYHAHGPNREPCEPEPPHPCLTTFAEQLEGPPAGARVLTSAHL
jgi:hypothetical protein